MEKQGLNWAAIGAIAGVIGVVVAVLAWIAPWKTDATDASTGGSPNPAFSSPAPVDTSTPAAPDTPESAPPAQPTSVFLTDLTPLERNEPKADSATMGGIPYVHAIAVESGGCVRDQDSRYSYVINGQYQTLTPTIGVDDRTSSEQMVYMEVLLDGAPAFSQTVQAGQYPSVSLDVSGARELVLHQTYIGPESKECAKPANAVWGDPLLSR